MWFTADTHFGHVNIIQYCNRPWAHSRAMEEGLISNWNSVVDPGDTVYHLGDFLFARGIRNYTERLREIASYLNGRIIVLPGNHDKSRTRVLGTFFEIAERNYRIRYMKKNLILDHYPSMTVDEGDILLHGHSHGNIGVLDRHPDGSLRRFDVGVDSVARFLGDRTHVPGGAAGDYRPISISELPLFMAVDGEHGPRLNRVNYDKFNQGSNPLLD